MAVGANNRHFTLMSIAIFICSTLLSIAGCKQETLSTEECRLISSRELAFKKSLLKFEPNDQISEDLLNKAAKRCMSEQPYTRKDFYCIKAAKTEIEMSRCMAQIHEAIP